MKKLFLLAIVSVFSFQFSFAQGVPAPQRHTVNFESHNGETFTVFVDGEVVNRMPQGHVMVNDVSSQTHEVVVVLKRPEQKAAVLQLLPREPLVTVYVDYDARLEHLMLYTPSYNLAQGGPGMQEGQGVQGIQGVKGSARMNEELKDVGVGEWEQKVVTEEDLAAMMMRMKGQSFDSDRLALGKVIVASSHLTAAQIAKLASILDFSASQVDFLKYAYGYCADPQNYYRTLDVLTFNSDKQKVMDFIATQ